MKQKLVELGIEPADTVAIGDSPADIPMFEFSGHSICIDPKHGAGGHAESVIHDDLNAAIPIIKKLL